MSADTCCNTDDDVILSSNIINLDKNCIKYREKSYKKFLTRPLSVPANLNLTKRWTTVLRQTSHEEQRTRLDLDVIKKLEEEIYKKREMVYLNYDANKAAGSTTSSSQTTVPTSAAERNITFNRNICPHITTTTANQKPVLYLDAEKFEPILLRNDQHNDVGNGHSLGDKNHSVVIIDNSNYYPILMRYDVSEEHFNNQQQQRQPNPQSKNTETVDAENGPTSSSTSIKFKRFLFNRNSFSFRFKNKRRRKQQQQDDHEDEVATTNTPPTVQRSNSDNSIAHAPHHWGNEGNSIFRRIPVYQAFSEPDLNEETATTTTTLTATTSSSTATSTNSQRRGHLQQNRYDLILKNPNNSTQICFVKNSAPKKRSNKYVTKNANNVMLRHSTGPSTSAVKTWIYRRR